MELVKQVLTAHDDMYMVTSLFTQHPPSAGAFDTETTGLSIIKDRPFLFQFGWINLESLTIYAFAIDLTAAPDAPAMIRWWHELAAECPVYLGHNVKYDLHMITNIDLPYTGSNLSDTQFYIRFAHDNVSARQGGVLLGLKSYCSKYIDPTAALHDKAIQAERAAIAKHYNQQLKNALGWTIKKIDMFFNDPTNELEDLPDVQDYLHYTDWHASLPWELKHVKGKITTDDVPYTMVTRELVLEYSLYDIYWTLLVWHYTWPVIQARGTEEGLRRENEALLPLWKMERAGMAVDRKYVDQCYQRMRQYIRKRRQDLKDLTGMDVTVSQNAVLLNYFREQGLTLAGTGAEILDRVHVDYPGHPTLPIIQCVQELRTLEKWFTTYLMRFKDQDMLYTQINQVGAASLRMSSDFQQFPKKGLKDNEGNELFNPRRAIGLPPGFPTTVYLDYSQIELRVQALYTILVGHPDLNLCRAYMPYQCIRGDLQFNPEDPGIRARWREPGWCLEESPDTPWTPTDVHGATTKAAFSITEEHPDYHDLRYLGKRVNFAKNYGAQGKKIGEMFPDYDAATIKKIDEGYYKAFPGIKYYQNYCYQLAQAQPYATNLFGVRYWGVSGHNLINMLIQGSSATFLKEKIVELDKFLTEHNCRTVMATPIHDEIQFYVPEEEMHIIPLLKKIMEDWDVYVPIVADAEITRTYWSEKEAMEL